MNKQELRAYCLKAMLTGNDPANTFDLDEKPLPRTWRFKLAESILSLRHGLILQAAHQHGDKAWRTDIASLPKEVIEQIGAAQVGRLWHCPRWKRLADIEEMGLTFEQVGATCATLVFSIMLTTPLDPDYKKEYVRSAAQRLFNQLQDGGEPC